MSFICVVIVPMLVYAQSTRGVGRVVDFGPQYEWFVDVDQGCVLAISGDSINFEEQWLHLVPNDTAIMSKDGYTVSFGSLKPPFWAEVSYGGIGRRTYLRSIRFLAQYKFEADGSVSGEYRHER